MKVGIALGSGGAKGLAHIAYLEVLDQLMIKTSRISGSSMGALVGALYAAGMSARAMRELATGISLLDIPRLVDLSGPLESGIIKGRKIEEWIRSVLPVRRFEDLAIPLRIVATDFWRREEVVFDSGELAPAIRASIAIPGVFEPYELGGRCLIDGGVVNPVPVDLLDGADFLVGIDVGGDPGGAGSGDPGRIEVLLGAYAIMGRLIMESRMRDEKVAIYRRPALRGFRVGDFLKADEILASVAGDAEGFRRELAELGVDRKAR